jgi:putative transposase
MVSFKGAHYPKDIILHAIFSMSGISFLTSTLNKFRRKEGGVKVDHATLNRWAVRYSSSSHGR